MGQRTFDYRWIRATRFLSSATSSLGFNAVANIKPYAPPPPDLAGTYKSQCRRDSQSVRGEFAAIKPVAEGFSGRSIQEDKPSGTGVPEDGHKKNILYRPAFALPLGLKNQGQGR